MKEENIVNTDKIIAEKIASEYVQKNTNKLEALKKLDRKNIIFTINKNIENGYLLNLVLCDVVNEQIVISSSYNITIKITELVKVN